MLKVWCNEIISDIMYTRFWKTRSLLAVWCAVSVKELSAKQNSKLIPNYAGSVSTLNYRSISQMFDSEVASYRRISDHCNSSIQMLHAKLIPAIKELVRIVDNLTLFCEYYL